ncbi:MAG: hypothetical protein HFG70_07850 [Hungatella sp.]|nr:hypothetical protein [Hungatella sp.]
MEIRKQKGKQVGRLTVTDKQHQEDLQRLRLLRPIDDDFMRCLFKDNIPLAEFVLRIITDKPDLIITDCETQKDMKRLAGARSICLDAYGTDSDGKKYDLEVQRQDKGADPHRARDGEHILYVNGEYRGDSAIGKLMHDFNCTKADDMNFELMANRTRYLKENPKGVNEMCKIMEEMRIESLKEVALRMLAAGKYALEEIANISGLSLDEVKKLKTDRSI